jgi:hypothetical protein
VKLHPSEGIYWIYSNIGGSHSYTLASQISMKIDTILYIMFVFPKNISLPELLILNSNSPLHLFPKKHDSNSVSPWPKLCLRACQSEIVTGWILACFKLTTGKVPLKSNLELKDHPSFSLFKYLSNHTTFFHQFLLLVFLKILKWQHWPHYLVLLGLFVICCCHQL